MDITGAILLAVIGVVMGFLLGALVFTLRRDSSPQPASRKVVLSDEKDDLRIWREGKDASLVIEIEGASYHRESDLDAEQNRRLTSLINELHAFMRTPAPQPVPPPAAQTESLKPVVTQTAGEGKRTSLNPFQIFTRSLQPREKSEPDEIDKSIVAQIDEILQESLEDTQFADQGIHLLEGPDQGMLIEVGRERYTDIEAVPDAEIRGLIRQAVSEWESLTED